MKMDGEKSLCNSKDEYMCFRILKQLCLFGVWVSMGLCLEVIGPTIPDIMAGIDVNYEEISRALVGISVGYFTGSILGGIIHERFYKYTDLFLCLGILCGSLGIVAVPLMTSLWPLSLALLLVGISVALNNAGGNAMVLHLWREKSGPPMYSLHFGFGLGSIIAPQIAKPFLDYQETNNFENFNNFTINSNYSDSYRYTTDHNSSNSSIERNNYHLLYPFSIIGAINAIFAVFMFIFFLYGTPKGFPKREGAASMRALCSPKLCTNSDNQCYGILLLLLLFLYYVQAVGGENVYGKWIFSFAIETDVSFTKQQATTLTSVFWLCHMTGRGMGMILSKFISISYIILCDIFGIIIVSVLLAMLGHKLEIVLWVLSAVMGMLVSPLFPAGLLWANEYLNSNSMTVMVCILGGSTGFMVYVYASGYMFQYYGPRSIMVIEIIYGVLLFLIFTLMEIMGRMNKKKSKKHEKNATDVDLKESCVVEEMLKTEKL